MAGCSKFAKGFCLVFIWAFSAPLLLTGVAVAQNTLTILSTTDTEAFNGLTNKFMELNPDITIDYQELTTNEVFSAVMNAKRSEAAKIDLIISSAMDLQVKLVNEGLALPFTSDVTDSVPDWARWRNELFGFTYEPIVYVYNRDALSDYQLPRSHWELAEFLNQNRTALTGRIGTYDLNLAGAGYLFLTQDAIQSEQIFRLIEEFGQTKTRTFCCTADILDLVSTGELVLGYNVIGSYALERARHDKNIVVLPFKDYTIVMARTAFIYKYSANQEAAERFLEFLLSTQGQQEIAHASALIPLSSELRKQKLPQVKTNAYLPIKLGIGLLTYQDSLKRQKFLNVWNKVLDLNADH